MARRKLTERQQLLQEALTNLKVERAVLKQQQARVAVARRVVEQLSCCDCCGAKVPPTGEDLQLCWGCAADRRELKRVQLLAQHGYGPDGKRLAA
jgi:hypothetical protein